MKDNIVLIGMPGSGKSTVGVVLAKRLAYDFVDSDLVIQAKAGMRLQNYIDQFGPDAFEDLENKVNAGLNVHHTVIATGGSAVYGEDAMRHFQDIAVIVYLKVSFEELQNRIPDFETRGIVIPKGQSFQDVYNIRSQLYERYADITVGTEKIRFWDLAEEISRKVGDFRTAQDSQ